MPPRGRPVMAPDVYVFPASYAQERLWFVEQLQPGSGAYHIALPLTLPVPLDVAAFARSLEALVDRHEALRTTFAAPDGRPLQVVHAPRALPVPLAQHDLRALDAPARQTAAARLFQEASDAPF